MMPIERGWWFSLLLLLAPVAGAADQGPKVIASIKPVHSLVAGVMAGLGTPVLLIKGGASPHDYSLRPSDVQRIQEAQVVFWIGAGLESFLARPLQNAKARQVALLEAPGVERLAIRAGGAWEEHEEQHDAHDHHEDSSHSRIDPHIWLDPRNALALVRQIGAVLGEVDPVHRADYAKNAAALSERLLELDRTLGNQLAPVRNKPYIVFHDAFQYFERRYGLAAVGSITVSPEQRPGARRIRDIRERVVSNQVLCVFSEPQFEPALVQVLIEGTPARSGALDELGAALPEGPEAYFQLLNFLADALRACLGANP